MLIRFTILKNEDGRAKLEEISVKAEEIFLLQKYTQEIEGWRDKEELELTKITLRNGYSFVAIGSVSLIEKKLNTKKILHG